MEKQFKCFFACYKVDNEKYHYFITVKRVISGAFAYGNRSAHQLDIYDQKTKKGVGMPRYFDTRYDTDIPSENLDEWCDFWKQYIFENWVNEPNVELLFCDLETTTLKD